MNYLESAETKTHVYNAISKQLNEIIISLNEHIKNEESIDFLQDLRFDRGHKPDYSKPAIQKIYLLRYIYAYSYEYLHMFCSMIKYMKRDKYSFSKSIDVLSVGCGAAFDYSAIRIASMLVLNLMPAIHYIGVDVINWEKHASAIENDTIILYEDNIVSWIHKYPQCFVNSDLIIFPKSLFEITRNDFSELLNTMCKVSEKANRKKEFTIVAGTLRNNSLVTDRERFYQFVRTYTENFDYEIDNYFLEPIPENTRIAECPIKVGNHTEIRFPKYDDGIRDRLKSLYQQCRLYQAIGYHCRVETNCENALGFKDPILSTNYTKYILAFLKRRSK